MDHEGYYIPQVDELLDQKYRVAGIAGKGVFSCVVKAVDERTLTPVAIKIIRA